MSHRHSTPIDTHFASTSDYAESLSPIIQSPSQAISKGSLNGGESSRRSSRRPASRIIRTFDEVHVTKTINTEEWYEELECGVCSHILGAPQTLVPCGHSLCGPCAYEWIKKGNNLTCPHCRHQLHEKIPFVPNIVVDQIIERKLRGLIDSPEKNELIAERTLKLEAWKMVQDNVRSAKSPKRRNFDDIIFGFFDADAGNAREANVQRRASRHVQELGAPLQHQHQQAPLPHPAMGGQYSLAELRRREFVDNNIYMPDHVRRLRELRDSWLTREREPRLLESLDEEEPMPRPARGQRRNDVVLGPIRDSPPPMSPPLPSAVLPPNRPLTNQALPTAPIGPRPLLSRAPVSRSQALTARQARGRGSREQPLVILSDSDSE